MRRLNLTGFSPKSAEKKQRTVTQAIWRKTTDASQLHLNKLTFISEKKVLAARAMLMI